MPFCLENSSNITHGVSDSYNKTAKQNFLVKNVIKNLRVKFGVFSKRNSSFIFSQKEALTNETFNGNLIKNRPNSFIVLI